MLDCGSMYFPFKYLNGVSIRGNPRKVDFWRPIIHKIKANLSMWKGKLLSMAGRLCLIKLVIIASPLFYLSFFKAPKQLCKTIRTIQSNFFWGWNSEGKKIHWVAWNRVCRPVEKGGLGYKDVQKFNFALLAKWKCRLRTGEEGAWRDVIESKYGNWRKMKDSMVERKSCHWWKNLCSICEVNNDFNWYGRRIRWKHGN